MRGDGDIQFEGTRMVLHGEVSRVGWSTESLIIPYKELGAIKETKAGFQIRLGAGMGLIGKKVINADLAEAAAGLKPAIIEWLRLKRQYPQCHKCGSEVDLETKACRECGLLFSEGVRLAALPQLAIATVGLAIGGALIYFQLSEAIATWTLIICGVWWLVSLLSLAGGKGMQG